MEQHAHSMDDLFNQLGQSQDSEGILKFIQANQPLAGDVRLHNAAFWSPSQAAFLQQAISDDADWAEVVEALNSALHASA
ncbi:DUF2789 family protein [Dechloromonas agitata]|uniref:DUF2789 family protein n=1 Tax=Dechloromonas agitata TaxID=73030 RepID=UPI00237ED29C|nr:DUF2789 family protein [Dechloromonas agitata]MDE1547567.1 DUF2789 family protein [Dechloromonas agitata]